MSTTLQHFTPAAPTHQAEQYETSINSNKSTGITHQIRLKIGFNDEKAWKKFSSRRLELIDTMNLSHKKASEQDKEILQCSRALMKEFEYDEPRFLPEFIKLVRVAIQSVRRNRKRSTKSSRNSTMTKSKGKSNATKFVMVKQISPPKSDFDSEEDESDDGFNITDVIKTDNVATSYNSMHSPHSQSHSNSPYAYNNSSTQKLPINSLLQPVFHKSKKSMTKLPSFSSILMDDDIISSGNSQVHHNHHLHGSGDGLDPTEHSEQPLPEQVKLSQKEIDAMEKLLSLIKKSKTCTELSLDLQTSASTSFYENLEMLGSTTILSTISYIFEKFFVNLNPSSISYLRLKLNNDFTLSKILKNLDISLNETYYNDFISAQTFKRLVGCCVKDFGFDAVISPLTDIIHEIILKGYPLISKNLSLPKSTGGSKSSEPEMRQFKGLINIPSQTTLSSRAVDDDNTTATPQPPAQQHQHQASDFISVKIMFNNNFLNFKFDPISTSKPTYIELVENLKDAFNLHAKNIFLRNLSNMEVLRNDDDVAKVFDSCTDNIVHMGVYVAESSERPRSAMSMHGVNNNPKISSPLDTLSSAAEMFESRSQQESDVLPYALQPFKREKTPEIANKGPEKIIFQPLL